MTDKIEVTKEFLQSVTDILKARLPISAHAQDICEKIDGMLGGWKPLSDLRGRISTGRDVAEIYELKSLDGKTGALVVSVSIPNTTPADMLVFIDQRDGVPVSVDQRKFTGWRPYVFPEEPS